MVVCIAYFSLRIFTFAICSSVMCGTGGAHTVRHTTPFPSQRARASSVGKTTSFSFCQVDMYATSPYCNSSHDCRALAKPALICHREIVSYRNDNNHKFTVEEHSFKEQCQETSVPDDLKFLVGMIVRGPPAEETVTETQATLSMAQLVFFNTTTKATHANRTEIPLSVYILDSTFILGSGVAKWWMS